MAVSISIMSYDPAMERRHFASGVPELDSWLRTQATQQERRGNCRTIIAVDHDDERVVGYLALCASQLQADDVANLLGYGVRYPMPAVLVARLAVDRPVQGQGIGALLIEEALRRAVVVSEHVGCEVIVVRALDEWAAGFYARLGFRRFFSDPQRLWLGLKDARRTLQASDLTAY